MTQTDLSDLMAALGTEWTPGIVGFVERNDRAVTVDEYVALALCLGVTVGALLDPTGPGGIEDLGLDLTGTESTGIGLDAPIVTRWARGESTIRFEGGASFYVKDRKSKGTR